MPVDTTHPDYNRWATHWRKMRDVVLGQEAMEAACVGATLPQGPQTASTLSRGYYLPRLSGQTEDEYRAYVRRAEFYGATARTIDALTGAVFRRDPVIAASDQMIEQLEDVDLAGTALAVYAQQDVREALTVGQYATLIDLPPVGGTRPYWVGYASEDVLCVETARVGGATVFRRVVLRESTWTRGGDDGYQFVPSVRVRELELDEAGQYRVRLYDCDGRTTERLLIDEAYPTRAGERLTFIPFFTEWPLRRPPLLDLADVNLSHYRKAADYAHGLHFTALPTPWIADRDIPTTATFKIGSESAWTMSEVGSCGMLEFSGAGMSAIKDAMIDSETRMAHLGAELLMPDKRAAEAAAALRIRSGAKTASLAALANRSSWRLTKAAQAHAWWIGESDEAVAATSVTLNTEFAESYLEPQELTAWVQARQAGEVTRRMFLDMMARKEALGETTVDEAVDELEGEADATAEKEALKAEAARFRDMAALAGMAGRDAADEVEEAAA